MRVLVTGSQGYIGTILVPMLQNAGHEVFGLDTDFYAASAFTDCIVKIPETIRDIREELDDVVAGCNAIIHLAGLSNDPLGDYNPSLTKSINFRASVQLAQTAKKTGVERFLFASSCSNYGASSDQFLDENAKFNPVTPYGESKVLVESELNKLADKYFSPTYLRASTAYGVSPKLRFDLVVNNLTAWAFTTGKVYLKSDGTPWRPIVHVEDICRAYIAALHAPRELIHNEAFNVGTTAENYQIKEIAQIVEQVVPGCKVEFAPDAGPDKRCYRVDCNKIARVLHEFKPQWTARRGVEQLYESYQTVGLKLEDFEGPKFKRIAHIKQLIDEKQLDKNLRWL
ncbi:MAG: NAD(P)-dependent oxidoreductase [Gammaproteobacteria bacterium]